MAKTLAPNPTHRTANPEPLKAGMLQCAKNPRPSCPHSKERKDRPWSLSRKADGLQLGSAIQMHACTYPNRGRNNDRQGTNFEPPKITAEI